ncbi:MAG: CehA/McbA family metallohydrolase [Woeseiaceae bacterium]|nr:CehA/McbA family metallohydrolase [Woeseiaceae bacterium]
MSGLVLLAVAVMLLHGTAVADRAPVLKQIAVPHDYYFREMYLPQLTSGPSSLSWLPAPVSSRRPRCRAALAAAVNSDTARQLTAGPGYDYQPDVSPDGSSVVFVRYADDAMNLYQLDLETGATTPLTSGTDVNLEPRWSPDGSRLAFVSTRGTGRFHVFIGSVDDNGMESAPLMPERKSTTPRYYYGEYDHELSPSWSPDGSEILYVANPEIIYGSGAIWRRPLDASGAAVPVRVEETTWRAQPDWSPDGRRVIYASYLGRQWHQLWLTTAEGGGDPMPLSYGDHDISAPRWSPDGEKIAYVTNEGGGLGIRIQTFVSGKVEPLEVAERDYLRPAGILELSITDRRGRPVAARVQVTGSDGRRYAPDNAWMHADDSFDRDHSDFEMQYFHSSGKSSVALPEGPATIRIWRGLEHHIVSATADVTAGETLRIEQAMQPLDMPPMWKNQVSGDVHVHMNYGGHYRNTPPRLVQQAAAEDLDVVFNLIVNKEQRIPDIAWFTPEPDPATTRDVLLVQAQEYHTSYWGHMGLLGLKEHYLLPDYSAYANTGAASLYPDNATVADLAHAQSALVGYVHPFLSEPDPENEAITNGLPVDAALGNTDFYEVVGFADHRSSAAVWYRLLNCGMRMSAAGGTDAMANYASLRGPVGINRTYVTVEGNPRTPAAREAAWLSALRDGRSLATNGPLLGLSVDGNGPGQDVALPEAGQTATFRGFMRSIVPVDHLELVQNGRVVKTFDTGPSGVRADIDGTVTIDEDGWLLLRAWNDKSSPDVFDLYPYATTNPVFFDVAGDTLQCGADADYFLAWIDRIRDSAASHPDYNTDRERQIILDNLDRASAVFDSRR